MTDQPKREELRMTILDALAETRRESVRECDGEELAEDVEAWSTREQYDLEHQVKAVMNVFPTIDRPLEQRLLELIMAVKAMPAIKDEHQDYCVSRDVVLALLETLAASDVDAPGKIRDEHLASVLCPECGTDITKHHSKTEAKLLDLLRALEAAAERWF